MKKTITLFFVFILISILITVFYSFAEEKITLTTYYPAPYGVYRELRADQMAIGSGYRYNSQAPLSDGLLLVNGSVGIGTTDPGTKLHVRNTGFDDVALRLGQDDVSNPEYGYLNVHVAPLGAGRGHTKFNIITNNPTDSNIRYDFRVNDSSLFYIRGDGNVGIGTPSPERKLHIVQSQSGDGLIIDFPGTPNIRSRLSNIGTGSGPFGGLLGTESAHSFGISTNNQRRIHITSDGNVGIGTVDPGTAKLTVMGGNVGIGTNNPQAKLDVNGSIKATSYPNFKFGIATGAPGSGGNSYWGHQFDINTGFSNVIDAIAIPQWSTQAGWDETLNQIGCVVTSIDFNTPSNGYIRVHYDVKARWRFDDATLDVRFIWIAIGSS